MRKARQQSKTRKQLAQINVVPYIDVMLVLLVIFMVTTPLLSQGVKVNLPKAKAKALSAKQQEPIILSVDAKGFYYLNTASNPDRPLVPNEIIDQVAAQLRLAKKQHNAQQVYVKGDQSVGYGKVMQAMVLLQRAGANNIGLITQPLPANVTKIAKK